MKILFITNEFPNPFDPTKSVFNRSMARALSRQHEVQIVSPISWTDEWSARRVGASPLNPGRCEIVDGIDVHHPRYLYPPRVLRSRYGWFYRNSIRATLRRLSKSFHPDVVLSYWAHPDGKVATQVARQIGVPSIVVAAGSDVLVVTEDSGRRHQVARALQSADAVIAFSQHLKTAIIALGADASKVHLWRRGVDDCFAPGDRDQSRRQLGISAGARVIVWVGRMVPVKDPGLLMKACEKARDRGAAFRAYLVGDGPLRSALETERVARGLEDVVHFVGSCEHDRLADWYRAADLTVLTSRSEGLPNVLRESLACGTPFVATNVGGIAELTAGHPEWLVAPGNADALADAIVGALTSRVATADLPRTIRWPEATDALVRIIQQVMPLSNDVPMVCEAT